MSERRERPELPVEPLSDAAWRRVERGLFERLRSDVGPRPAPRSGWLHRSRAFWLAASAALLLAAASLGRLTGPFGAGRYATRSEGKLIAVRGVTCRLAPDSTLVRAGSTWTLRRGSAEFHVAPRGKGDPLRVLAGDVRVEVVGTLFSVTRVDGSARVETREGRVRVTRAGATQLVAAGERWPAPEPSVAVETRKPALQAADNPETNTSAESAAARRRYEQAAAYEASDATRALGLYRSLAQTAGSWAQNALFALARLELERNLRAEAERDLRAYLQRYPEGDNAADARALLARIHAAGAASRHAR